MAGSRSGMAPNRNSGRAASSSSSRSLLSKADDTATFSSSSSSSKDSGSTSDLLREWASHTSVAYHDFDPAEAAEIRSALLDWYRTNRRKLPWRGDPPPYDGSTAGINNVSNNGGKSGSANGKNSGGKKKGCHDDKKQPSINTFFAVKEKKTVTNKAKQTSKVAAAADDETTRANQEEKKDDDHLAATIAPTPVPVPASAYHVWVSEIMLQQTRVEAVIPYYLKWMAKFPTVHSLAAASEEEVNSHWAGLGFYRRARMLHAGAKRIVERFDGQLPSTVEELQKIEGVGRYTASAIASIAFDVTVPVVDGNVCRVLARLRGVANHIKAPIFKDDVGWKLASQIVEAGGGSHAGEVNQALMELGATYCAPSGTGLDGRDPLREFYVSTRIGREVAVAAKCSSSSGGGDDGAFDVDEFVSKTTNVARGRKCGRCSLCDPDGVATVMFDISQGLSVAEGDGLMTCSDTAATIGHGAFPTAPPKKAKREEVLAVAAIRCRCTDGGDDGDQWLMVKRPKDGLLAGQWEFPSVCVWSSGDDEDKKKKGKKKTPKKASSKAGDAEVAFVRPQARGTALDSFLASISSEPDEDELEGFACNREHVGEAPIEHIFSHVRHTMWLEYGELSAGRVNAVPALATADGRKVRFMTEDDMKTVGITSGVKKLIAAVKKAKLDSRRQSPKKRRRMV